LANNCTVDRLLLVKKLKRRRAFICNRLNINTSRLLLTKKSKSRRAFHLQAVEYQRWSSAFNEKIEKADELSSVSG